MSALSPSDILAATENAAVPPTAPVAACGCVSTDTVLVTDS